MQRLLWLKMDLVGGARYGVWVQCGIRRQTVGAGWGLRWSASLNSRNGFCNETKNQTVEAYLFTRTAAHQAFSRQPYRILILLGPVPSHSKPSPPFLGLHAAGSCSGFGLCCFCLLWFSW